MSDTTGAELRFAERPKIKNYLTNELLLMIKNYLKVAFRKLWSHKAYSFINIMGLTIEEAIAEEKRIKVGSRLKKIKLIEGQNPNCRDLWEDVSKW